MTLEESIRFHAGNTPHKPAVICGKDSISYSCLWENILKRASELEAGGLRQGRPYVYRATQDIDFIVTKRVIPGIIWGLVLGIIGGIIMVAIFFSL